MQLCVFICAPTLTAHAILAKYVLMERNSKNIVKRLKREGFELVATKGSHHKFRKGQCVVTVPHPKKDLPIGTARNIAKQAGWL